MSRPITIDGTRSIRRLVVALVVCTLLVGALVIVPIGLSAQPTHRSESPLEPRTAIQSDNGSVNLRIDGTDDIDPNESTTATVTAIGASNGISAYELTLELSSEAARIGNVEVHADGDNGPLTDVTYTDNQTEVTVAVALLEATHDPADEIELFDVVLEGRTAGQSTFEITNIVDFADRDIEQYTIGNRTDETFTVGDPETELSPSPTPSNPETTSNDSVATPLQLELEPVESTSPVAVNLTATNTGDEPLEQEINIAVDDVSVETLTVNLGPEEQVTRIVPLSLPDTVSEANAVSISATGETVTADTVAEPETQTTGTETETAETGPPALTLEAVEFPSQAAAGDTVTAAVTVSNSGDERITETVSYALDETRETTEITVESNATVTETVELVVPANAADVLEQRVTVGTDERTDSLTIEPRSTDDSTPGFGLLSVVLALGLAGYHSKHR